VSARGGIALRVEAPDTDPTSTVRRREPVAVGIPFARGAALDPNLLSLTDEAGAPIPRQVRVLDRWRDGSIRWALIDFQASTREGLRRATYQVHTDGGSAAAAPPPLEIHAGSDAVAVDTGAAAFRLRASGPFPFESVSVTGTAAIDPVASMLLVEDENGRACKVRVHAIDVEEHGAIRSVVRCDGDVVREGDAPFLTLRARLTFFAGSPTVRCSITLGNPRPAAHPGGIWTLGDAGSVYVKGAAVIVSVADDTGAPSLRCSVDQAAPLERVALPFELLQESSGGKNWASRNHVNRRGEVPLRFRGYRLDAAGAVREGLRATPVVILERGKVSVAAAIPYFWQNFPRSVSASGSAITIGLLPGRCADLHEIQGGEQKTHVFCLSFGNDGVTDTPLAWCRSPSFVHADPEYYCSSGAVPGLAVEIEEVYAGLIGSAIDGEQAFARKREIIDEYGWRNFGDIYADHEQVFSGATTPIVSHYNNQYDAIAGFGHQFLRSGDRRWWDAMHELSAHVADIDVYHTSSDKSAYNGGLFWHTFHYVDAGTSTHRTYPTSDKLPGGGPSAEHNYTTGLTLHHFLTGDPLSREIAIGLAEWVVDMDDGSKTVFRWLDRGYTGQASASGSVLYHGPGRGAANSIVALLNGHHLTSRHEFLEKAEQLIRRCIHPSDDIASRDLLNAEQRWFYTVFLEALGRYLSYKEERGDIDRMYAYARASLLHYARWMADHEYPYLDKPEKLEYPTETWAAQDMRKRNVFEAAANYTTGGERERFLERAAFFYHASTTTLRGMATKTLTRPVVVMLATGYASHFHGLDNASSSGGAQLDFGIPERFEPQKLRARRRAVAVAAIGGFATFAGLLSWLL
jgi:hypothetical protein